VVNYTLKLYVSGHSNIDGKETADEHAKQAAMIGLNVGREPALRRSLMNVKYQTFQWCVQKQHRR